MNKSFKDSYGKAHNKRFQKTATFLNRHLGVQAKILDLGPENPFSEIMKNQGHDVMNTARGIDLDLEYDIAKQDHFDAVTAFEIFEHMVSPFNLLQEVKAKKLFASVPLRLWFSKAYWNDKDPWDCHYHEFESRQFDFLLNKSGWKIIDSEKWISPTNKVGIRPILRRFTPRHYIVYCERK